MFNRDNFGQYTEIADKNEAREYSPRYYFDVVLNILGILGIAAILGVALELILNNGVIQ